MVELLLEHRAVGQPGQHVVEGELGDPLLAFGDLADHLVEAGGQPRQLVAPANPDLDMLARARRPAASSSRASGWVIRRAAFHVAMPTSSRPSIVMRPSASWSLRASAIAAALG